MLRLYPLLLGMLLVLVLPPLVQARPEYAQEQQKKCKACHLRNGNGALNADGEDFRKSLYMQKGIAPPAEKKKQLPEIGKEKNKMEESGVVVKKERPRKKQKQPEDIEDEESEEEEPAEEPEPPKTVVYRWQGKDGSMVFSERPQPAEKESKVDLKKNRKVGKPDSAARTLKKQTVARHKSPAPKPAPVATAPPSVEKKNFPECMEAELADRPEPATADEIMSILIEARSKCSRYEKGTM